MKKNTTTEATTTVPQVTPSEVTAAAAAALLDQVNGLAASAVEAVGNNMSESDFIRYISMAYFAQASDLDELKKIQANAAECYKKASIMAKAEAEVKAEAEAIAKYQSLNAADRIMAKVTRALIDFCDNEIAKEINHMIYENATSIKVACFVGSYQSDEKAMEIIKYVYESIKNEKELTRFSSTFVRVVEELCK